MKKEANAKNQISRKKNKNEEGEGESNEEKQERMKGYLPTETKSVESKHFFVKINRKTTNKNVWRKKNQETTFLVLSLHFFD